MRFSPNWLLPVRTHLFRWHTVAVQEIVARVVPGGVRPIARDPVVGVAAGLAADAKEETNLSIFSLRL